MISNKKRCSWCLSHDSYIDYHDQEWGIPVHNDQKLFEMILLEGAQAGLSWITVLQKRAGYRQAFDDFNAEKIAQYTDEKLDQLKADPRIIRNRLKIASTVTNAKAFLKIQREWGSFDHYIWQFVGGKPIKNRWQDVQDIPITTQESDAMSRNLKQQGFKFVGSTICYAFMQACGMVNDHVIECFMWEKVNSMS